MLFYVMRSKSVSTALMSTNGCCRVYPLKLKHHNKLSARFGKSILGTIDVKKKGKLKTSNTYVYGPLVTIYVSFHTTLIIHYLAKGHQMRERTDILPFIRYFGYILE